VALVQLVLFLEILKILKYIFLKAQIFVKEKQDFLGIFRNILIFNYVSCEMVLFTLDKKMPKVTQLILPILSANRGRGQLQHMCLQ
jgi:hypothetical protein